MLAQEDARRVLWVAIYPPAVLFLLPVGVFSNNGVEDASVAICIAEANDVHLSPVGYCAQLVLFAISGEVSVFIPITDPNAIRQ